MIRQSQAKALTVVERRGVGHIFALGGKCQLMTKGQIDLISMADIARLSGHSRRLWAIVATRNLTDAPVPQNKQSR